MEFNLNIDRANLDGELLDHSQRVYEVNKMAALAEKERDEADFELKVIEADLEKEARERKTGTEGAIKNYVKTHEDYKNAVKKCIEKNGQFKTIQAGVTAFHHRKMALENLVKLYLSNYFAEPYSKDMENKLIEQQIEKQNIKATETLRRKRSNGKV